MPSQVIPPTSFDYESHGTLDETIELEDQDHFYDDFHKDWQEEE